MANNSYLLLPAAAVICSLFIGCSRQSDIATPATTRPEPILHSVPLSSAESPSATSSMPATSSASPLVQPVTPESPPISGSANPEQAVLASSDILDKIPLTTTTVPPYPFFEYPEVIGNHQYRGEPVEFDRFGIIVGNKVHIVEGRYAEILFSNREANLTVLASHRSYTNAIEALGAVKVNSVTPDDPSFLKEFDSPKLRKELHIPEREMSYDAYALRTTEGISWIVLMVNESRTKIFVAQAKELVSPVILKRAAAIKSELDAKGHIALYINFDTDKAVVKPDGKAAVDEISSVLKSDPALRLSIEGHTDNVGDAGHNSALSKQRAEAVLQSLLASGIDKTRLAAAGHGADKPLVPNTDEASRAKNRRVELVKVVKT
ncbi:OmpA family protein [Massilia violaceinigra]|uniref:OmpA family protein n=1 Tax=Massilia violaceinigra TaxID=2045208 RepID=A0ABY3ZZN4_9BURK|nr:OmpA family protein [Massilia violaceinigra]UOD27324.1 OmpA family protein [Massilia violaceinigra]